MSELDVAASRYLEGGMEDDERCAFEATLVSDPAVAVAVVRQAKLEARMRRILGVEREQGLAQDETPMTAVSIGVAHSKPRVPGMSGSGRQRSSHRSVRPPRRSVRRRARPALSSGPLMLVTVTLLALGGIVVFSALPEDVGPAPVQLPAFVAVGIDGSLDPARRYPVGTGTALRPDETLTLRSPDGSTTVLSEGAAFRVVAAGASNRLRLDDGRAQCSVTPQGREGGYEIRLRHAEVAVVGTHFTVATGAERSWLRVEEGRVRFTTAKENRILGPGEEAEAGPGVRSSAVVADQAVEEEAPPTVPTPTPVIAPRVVGFALVDAISGDPIRGRESLRDGERITLDPARPVAIVVRIEGPVTQVVIRVDDRQALTESNPPYALLGNPRPEDVEDEAFYPLDLSPGPHHFVVTPHGPDGAAESVTFRIVIEQD